MNEETLIKYLEFLKIECLRHQDDKIITDDEINQLQIEIMRFLEKINQFSAEIKNEILNIDFNLDGENHNKHNYKWLNFIGGFDSTSIKEQINRKNRLEKLYNDLDASLFKIKSFI